MPRTEEQVQQQRDNALRRANAVRTHRRLLKAAMAVGEVNADEVLANRDDDPMIATMEVHDLLLAVPGFGPQRVRAAFRKAHIPPHTTVRGLSSRQLGQLLVELRQHRVSSPRRWAAATSRAA